MQIFIDSPTWNWQYCLFLLYRNNDFIWFSLTLFGCVPFNIIWLMSSYILDILGKLQKQMFADFTHSFVLYSPKCTHQKMDRCWSLLEFYTRENISYVYLIVLFLTNCYLVSVLKCDLKVFEVRKHIFISYRIFCTYSVNK